MVSSRSCVLLSSNPQSSSLQASISSPYPACSFHIQAVATIVLGACVRVSSVVKLYVRTSAAFAAASLGDELLAVCELAPSVRPPCGVGLFCGGAAAVADEPTACPEPVKFLEEGLPKQLPMVREEEREGVGKRDGARRWMY
jgi:hypothetical protein